MMLLALALAQAAPALPVRVPLGDVPLPEAKTVERVLVMRVNFAPGQEMPRHVHPAPVVCMVENGSFSAQIGTAPAQTLRVGEASLCIARGGACSDDTTSRERGKRDGRCSSAARAERGRGGHG